MEKLYVIKRDQTLEPFNIEKIEKAIQKAFFATKTPISETEIKNLASEVFIENDTNIEEIQNQVEDILLKYGYIRVAKRFIKYRTKRQEIRNFVTKKEQFIEKYKKSSNTANATIDDNSNVSSKNIGVLNAEIHKEENIQMNRGMVMNKLKELYPNFRYKQYAEDLEQHRIYKHDESSFAGAIAPYCVSLSMFPFLNDGISGIGGLSVKPQNLDSFCGMYINLVFATAAMFAGAVATPEVLVIFDYYVRKAFGEDYIEHQNEFYKIGPKLRKLLNKTGIWFKDIDALKNYKFIDPEDEKLRLELVNNAERCLTEQEIKFQIDHIKAGDFNYKVRIGDDTRTIRAQIHQYFQQIIYSISQPAASRGQQSAFVNFAYFDKPFFESMFGNFCFPDGSKPIWKTVSWIQKEFMQWFNAERLKCMLTFPVESFALIYKDGKFEDQDSADFVSAEYARGHSFFTYISDTADSLSSCCRLKNKITTHEFNFTNGNIGVQTGSKSVITINLNRLIQDSIQKLNKTKYCKENYNKFKFNQETKQVIEETLIELLDRIYKYHHSYNELLWDVYDADLLPVYKAGFIHLNKQYLTIGLNGLNQAAEFLGIECNRNETYKEFCQFIFHTIKEQNLLHKVDKGKHQMTFNTEQVPAESASIKLYNWDKADGYWVPEDTNLYASYIFKPNDPNINVIDKMILHGKEYVGDELDGGMGCHINLDSHLSLEQNKKLLKIAGEVGCSYFTYNIINSECSNKDCHFITKQPIKVCPKCGASMIWYDRVIGYMTKIKSWSEGRQNEQKTRIYSNIKNV